MPESCDDLPIGQMLSGQAAESPASEPTSSQKLVNVISGLMAFGLPVALAAQIYLSGIQQNVASWLMYFLLDVLGLILVWREGNRRPYLQVGWTFASVAVLAALTLGDRPWVWGTTESLAFLAWATSLVLWKVLSARIALQFFLLAIVISATPQAIDYWQHPQLEAIWFWSGNVVACYLAFCSVPRRDLAHIGIPVTCMGTNGTLAFLCLL